MGDAPIFLYVYPPLLENKTAQVYSKTMLQKNGNMKEAKRILNYAKKEYAGAKKTRNEMKARQSAEKAYLCLLKTVNALFEKKGVHHEKVPRTEKGRIFFLSKYGDREARKAYHLLRHSLHIDAFHDGIINFKDLDERFQDLEELVKSVESNG